MKGKGLKRLILIVALLALICTGSLCSVYSEFNGDKPE